MELPIRAEYDNSDSAAGGEWYSLIDANNDQLLWKRYNQGSVDAMSADAAYIVNAVNSHEALVGALEMAMEWNWLDDDMPEDVIGKCAAALAAAKGGSHD